MSTSRSYGACSNYLPLAINIALLRSWAVSNTTRINLAADQSLEARRVRLVAREDRAQIGRAHVTRGNLGEDIAEVCRQSQVAAFVQLLGRKAGPFAIHLAALDRAAERESDAGVAVIGAARAVLPNGAPKLGHRQNHHIAHTVAEVLIKRRDALTKILQAVGELAARIALIGVRVPAAIVCESDFDADVGFDQLGDLQQ